MQDVEWFIDTKKICSLMEAKLNKAMKKENLTASQGYALVYIWEHHREGTYVTDLHRELGISKASISVLTKKLREKGFLKMEEQPGDERQRKIVMTDKLSTKAETLRNLIFNTRREIYSALSPKEQRTFEELQSRILMQIMKNTEQEAGNNDSNLKAN